MTETKTEFINQAEDLQSVESLGGQADYLYFRHEAPKEGSLPVLIAGGWSEGTQSLRDSAQEIFDSGREVILVDHARRGGAEKNSTDFHPEIVHKAKTLLSVLDAAGLDKVDVISHSEGALNTILAASWRPERFRDIVLVAPAGLIGEDSVPRLAARFVPKIIRGYRKDMPELKARDPESAKRFAVSGPRYIKANPVKALREINALAHTRIDKSMEDLRAAGIRIGVIQSHSDSGFPDKRIGEHVILEGNKANVDAYASVAAKDAGHDDLIIHPERSTRAALAMLTNFEELDQ
jgi:pimeloyl-ACP methyl ester carboxylesterase